MIYFCETLSMFLRYWLGTWLQGTGSALLADGNDVALIRATVVDSNGHDTLASGVNISFEVISGPGRVVGVGARHIYQSTAHVVFHLRVGNNSYHVW